MNSGHPSVKSVLVLVGEPLYALIVPAEVCFEAEKARVIYERQSRDYLLDYLSCSRGRPGIQEALPELMLIKATFVQ